MNTLQSILIGAGAAVVTVILAVMVIGVGEDGTPGRDGKDGVGALASPDIMSNYLSVGGVQRYYQKTTALTQGTSSVICALQGPAATSTLVSGGLLLQTSTTTGFTLHATKSLLPATPGTGAAILASSSYAGSVTALFTTESTSTVGGNGTAMIFQPNQYVLFDMTAGGGAGTFTPAGVCQATWEVFN